MIPNNDIPHTQPPPRSFRKAKWITFLLITLAVAALDQWSKQWAQQDLQYRDRGRISVIDNYFAFSYVRNPGAAWGFLAKASESFRQPFFVIISIAAILFILYIHHRLEPGQWLVLLAISLVMGGAVGNSIDRFHYRYVVDFIELHYQHRYKWPTFNVADIAITIGVILLFFEMFLGPWLSREPKKMASPSPLKPLSTDAGAKSGKAESPAVADTTQSSSSGEDQ
jgi:signal peptidase II